MVPDRVVERLLSRTAPGLDGCINYVTAQRRPKGYARIGCRIDGRRQMFYVHRVAWEYANGRAVAEGMTIDHLCRNPLCINPDHLEEVTNAENNRRARFRPEVERLCHRCGFNMVDYGVHGVQCRECSRRYQAEKSL